jgi:cytochrome c-type biogenesis protein CcmE
MAQATIPQPRPAAPTGGRAKFLIGGVILLAGVIYLIVSTLLGNQEYFITVNTMVDNPGRYFNQSARVSGAVLGDTIQYDGETLTFDIVNVPDSITMVKDDGGLADVLHAAVSDPNAKRLTIVVKNQPKPDLLKNEAQAIVTGKLGDDGKFYADELLLKCPTRYQQDVPDQAAGG